MLIKRRGKPEKSQLLTECRRERGGKAENVWFLMNVHVNRVEKQKRRLTE